MYERIFLEQEINVEGGENPELLKFRKLVICFVIRIAKAKKKNWETSLMLKEDKMSLICQLMTA